MMNKLKSGRVCFLFKSRSFSRVFSGFWARSVIKSREFLCFMKKYFLDTCIWVDLYEDRKGYGGEPFGDFAFELLLFIKKSGFKIIISDLTIRELEMNYSLDEINGLMKPFEQLLEKVVVDKSLLREAKELAVQRKIPKGDALHALIAKKYDFVLVTRDRHFNFLNDIAKYFKPEDII